MSRSKHFLGYAVYIGGILGFVPIVRPPICPMAHPHSPVVISGADMVTPKDAPRDRRKIPTRLTMPLSLKHLAPGVCVDLVVRTFSVAKIGLQLSQGGSRSVSHAGNSVYDEHQGARSVMISSLDELKGCLRITTEAEALEFVRLRTSFLTWDAWLGVLREVEILSPDQVKRIPNYGQYRGWAMRQGVELRPTGVMGVLRVSELLAGIPDYRPAQVSRGTDGFTVVRWLFWSKATGANWRSGRDGPRGIQRVREEIGRDGSYRRNIEVELPAHQLGKLTVPEGFL
jgi:hypothetical protein